MKYLVIFLLFFLTVTINAKWESCNDGIRNDWITHIQIKDQNKLFAGNYAGMNISLDYGDSWTGKNMGFDKGYPNIVDIKLINYYLYVFSSQGVFITYDDGEYWIKLNKDIDSSLIYCFSGYSDYLILGTKFGFFHSSIYNLKWDSCNIGFPKVPIAYSLAESERYIYASTNQKGVYVSTDNAFNWVTYNNILSNVEIIYLDADQNYVIASTKSHFYLSSDYGKTWLQRDCVFNSSDIQSIFIYDRKIFMGTFMGGLYFSSDLGLTWSYVGDGLTNSNSKTIYSYAISDKYIFLGTFGGVYREYLSEFDITSVSKQNEHNLIIYPNPVTDFLYLRNVKQSDKIEIISILGQTILTGNYHDKIDISSFPSGTYFLKVRDKTYKFIKI
jgi:hypothetical protein